MTTGPALAAPFWTQLWRWLGLPICLLYLLPLWQLCPYDHIDSSIEWVLNDAFAHGRRFGTELVWTSGPFGFLWADQFHPATWPLAVLLRVPFALALWWIVDAVVVRGPGKRAGPRLLIAATLLVCAVYTRETAVYVAGALWWFAAPRPREEADPHRIHRCRTSTSPSTLLTAPPTSGCGSCGPEARASTPAQAW